MAKYGMSLCVLGLAEELRDRGIAVNALWPRTVIDTAALNLLGGDDLRRLARRPEIVADAAHAILVRSAKGCTGNFFVDEAVLREEGVTDFSRYAVTPGGELAPDLFL
jgi:citronellol/citronellal dehydrogenase